MKNKEILRVIEYLAEFTKRNLPVRFHTMPDGKIPAEKFDYHLHRHWEIKFCSDPDELLIQAPGIIHCTTRYDWAFAVTPGFVRMEPWSFDVSSDKTVYNFLPELLDTLARMPENEDFADIRKSMVQAICGNLQMIIKKFRWQAEYDLTRRDLAERVLDYMKNHYFHTDLSVGDIARFAGVSPQYLNLLLRNKTGLGIRQNLIRIRLENAADLLSNPGCMVKDAAILTGWKSPFYFGNSFRRQYGCSPGEYQRKILFSNDSPSQPCPLVNQV